MADLPVTMSAAGNSFQTDAVLDVGGNCPDNVQSFVALNVQATVTSASSGSVIVGCSELTVSSLTVSQNQVQSSSGFCGGNIPSALQNLAMSTYAQAFTPVVQAAITQAIQARPCLH